MSGCQAIHLKIVKPSTSGLKMVEMGWVGWPLPSSFSWVFNVLVEWHTMMLMLGWFLCTNYFLISITPNFFLGHVGVSPQLPHFFICTCSHHFRWLMLSLLRTIISQLDLDFLSLSNTKTCLVSFCVILMSTSLESSVGLVMIGRLSLAFNCEIIESIILSTAS